MSQSPIRPLNVGNVVSAGIRLYSSHLKSYLGLAFTAALWFLVPVYGWAKAYTISALIARHAFSELIEQPESIQTVRSYVNPQMWKFLVTHILISLILFGTNIGFHCLLPRDRKRLASLLFSYSCS